MEVIQKPERWYHDVRRYDTEMLGRWSDNGEAVFPRSLEDREKHLKEIVVPTDQFIDGGFIQVMNEYRGGVTMGLGKGNKFEVWKGGDFRNEDGDYAVRWLHGMDYAHGSWSRIYVNQRNLSNSGWYQILEMTINDEAQMEVAKKILAMYDVILETKQPRWRAERGENYYFVTNTGRIILSRDLYNGLSEGKWRAKNYFKTREEAETSELAITFANMREDD